MSKYRNHLRFFLRCKHEGIIPPSLKIKCPINTKNAQDIVRKARKALLNERIRVNVNKIKNLSDNYEEKKMKVESQLPSNEADAVMEHLSNSKTRQYDITRKHHQQKLAKWKEKRDKIKFPSSSDEIALSGEQLK